MFINQVKIASNQIFDQILFEGDREQEQKVKRVITELAATRNSANVEIKTVYVLSLRLPDTLHLIVV